VESSRVSAEDGLGKFTDRDVTILSNQIVIMIWQQALCDDGKLEFASVFVGLSQDVLVIVFFEEDIVASGTTVVHVIILATCEWYRSPRHCSVPLCSILDTIRIQDTPVNLT
jgi:hypothetical protein